MGGNSRVFSHGFVKRECTFRIFLVKRDAEGQKGQPADQQEGSPCHLAMISSMRFAAVFHSSCA